MRKSIFFLFVVLLATTSLIAQRLPKGVTPENYEIKLGIDLAAQEFTGEETITLKMESHTARITLNSVDLKLNDVYLEQKGKQYPAKVEMDAANEMARFEFVE